MSNRKEPKARILLLGNDDAQTLFRLINGLRDAENDRFINLDPPRLDRSLAVIRPPFPQEELSWQTIRALGSSSDPQNREAGLPDEYRQAVRLLAVGRTPFALALSCNESGCVDFSVGLAGDREGQAANSLLRASFGLVDLFPAKAPTPGRCLWAAECTPVKRDPAELERKAPLPEPAKWADQAAAAIIGTHCTVRLSFAPVGSAWIDGRLKALYAAQGELSQYLKHHPQVSANKTIGDTFSENTNELISIQGKSHNSSGNAALSLNLSREFAVFDPEYESLDAALRWNIRLLEQARDGGWYIQAAVSAPSAEDPDAAVLRAAIGAAALPLGLQLVWRQVEPDPDMPAAGILPAYMLPALISFPTKPFVGFTVKRRSQLDLNPPTPPKGGADSISLGTLQWNGADTGLPLRIPREEMNRHTVVFGMTGAGKTTTVRSLLSSLDELHYLVIEPVKGDYHVLPGIHRRTMVAGDAQSLDMNPFWFPTGGSIQYHIDSLKLIISSAFDLYAAMPNILEQCLYRAYESCGWDVVTGQNRYRAELPDEDLYPTFGSLCAEVERYLDESAFEGETAGNYRGALLSRLQSFTTGAKGALLNTSSHIDFERWSGQNVVVELDALADDGDKAIVMGALLVQYFQFIKHQPSSGHSSGLRHLFVLEEAHHLFREDQGRRDGSNASGQLVRMLNDLLAEIRAYGEGFLIIDQSPSSVSPSVLKNTAVKIVHRVDYGDDIKLLQSALLLDEGDHITASLAQGEALVRFGTMQSPAHISIPNYSKDEQSQANKLPVQSLSEGAADRILSNVALLGALTDDAGQLMNLILFGADYAIAKAGLTQFKALARQRVSYYCGWDSTDGLTDHTCLHLLDVCTLRAAAAAFPGQYCLHRMIRMLMLRIARLRDDETYGGLTAKAWGLAVDYIQVRVNPRLTFYFQNHSDQMLCLITGILGGLPEAGVIRALMDDLWNVPTASSTQIDKIFDEVIERLFCLPPAEERRLYLKELTLRCCQEAARL